VKKRGRGNKLENRLRTYRADKRETAGYTEREVKGVLYKGTLAYYRIKSRGNVGSWGREDLKGKSRARNCTKLNLRKRVGKRERKGYGTRRSGNCNFATAGRADFFGLREGHGLVRGKGEVTKEEGVIGKFLVERRVKSSWEKKD